MRQGNCISSLGLSSPCRTRSQIRKKYEIYGTHVSSLHLLVEINHRSKDDEKDTCCEKRSNLAGACHDDRQ